jgi:hypothetical protein
MMSPGERKASSRIIEQTTSPDLLEKAANLRQGKSDLTKISICSSVRHKCEGTCKKIETLEFYNLVKLNLVSKLGRSISLTINPVNNVQCDSMDEVKQICGVVTSVRC